MNATLSIFVSLLVLLAAIPASAVIVFDEPDSLSKIDAARNRGMLDEQAALLYKVMAFSSWRAEVPDEFQSDAPITCGTPLADELALKWNGLSRDFRDRLISIDPHCALYDVTGGVPAVLNAYSNIYPDLTLQFTSRSGYFVLHYSLAGSNAVADVDIVKRAARKLDLSARALERMYGRKAKNADHVHVYFAQIGGWGACSYYPAHAAGNPKTAESYIRILRNIDEEAHPNYKRYGEHVFLGTLVHEYFHAVQNDIDCQEGSFMKETSSSWIEGVMFPQNRTYIVIPNRVPYVYQRPNFPIWHTAGNYHYASMLFQRFVHEKFRNTKINSEMWDACASVAGENGVAAVRTALAAHDTTWRDAIREYGINNYCNKYWDYRRNRRIWPAIWTVTNWSAYGVEPAASPNGSAEALYEMGSHFIKFNPPAGIDARKGSELLVKFRRTAGAPNATLLMMRNDRSADPFDVPVDYVDPNGYFELFVGGFGTRYESACLLVQARTSTGNDVSHHNYVYAAACPQVELKSFIPDMDTMGPGQVTPLRLRFDVEGVWNSMDYPLKYKAHIRGPGAVQDGVTDLIVKVRNGLDRVNVLYFRAGASSAYTPGLYHLGVQFIFGSTKEPSSRTKIVWAAVRLKPVEKNAAETLLSTGPSPPAFSPGL